MLSFENDLKNLIQVYFGNPDTEAKANDLVKEVERFAQAVKGKLEVGQLDVPQVSAVMAKTRKVMEGLPNSYDRHQTLWVLVMSIAPAVLGLADQEVDFVTHPALEEETREYTSFDFSGATD